jgi:hypothetical protein
MTERSAVERIKELDAERAKIFDQAKEEALQKATQAVAELNALGLNYRLTIGSAKADEKQLKKGDGKIEVSSENLPPARAYLVLFLVREMPTDTPSAVALAYVAPRVRFSFRAITNVFVFSRASVFSVRTSSSVHGRGFVVFAILSPSSMLVTNPLRDIPLCLHWKVVSKKVPVVSVPHPFATPQPTAAAACCGYARATPLPLR